MKNKEEMLPLTEINIEEWDLAVRNSNNYGKEQKIIHDVLNKYPLNNDINIIAMKIAVIDITNSTHISQYKSILSLYDLADVILKIPDFDERLKYGDPEIVNMIAKNTGAINLFSFASKYCTYHNVEIYEKDDYSIYDSVVKNYLPYYLEKYCSEKISSYKMDSKWRQGYDYKSYNECIERLLDKANIHIPFRRRKFDHFIWYANKNTVYSTI